MVVAGNKGDNATFKSGTYEERMKNKIHGLAINVKQIVKCVTCDNSRVLSQYLEVFNL